MSLLAIDQALEFILASNFKQPQLAQISQQIQEISSTLNTSENTNHNDAASSALVEYYKRLSALAHSIHNQQLANDFRSLFLPFLSSINLSSDNSTSVAVSPTMDEDLAPVASTVKKQGRGRPRISKRKSENVSASSAAAFTIESQPHLFLSSKCLVKRSSQDGSSTVYSSLPKDLLDTSELELVDEVTEMEIFPSSFSTLARSSSLLDQTLNDISPAVDKPSHLVRAPPPHKRKLEAEKVVSFLDFGSFASFAPTFDSGDSEIDHDDAFRHYVSLLAIKEYEQSYSDYHHHTSVFVANDDDAEQGKTRATQTLLSDVVDKEQIEEWLSSSSVKSNDKAEVSQEGDQMLGPDEVLAYLEQNGIDFDRYGSEKDEKSPSSHEITQALQIINKELLMLAALQQDRIQSAKLGPSEFASLFSLAVPKTIDAVNPLMDIVEPSTKPDSGNSTEITDLLKPTIAEKIVYGELVKKLCKYIPHAPTRNLVTKYAIRQVMKTGWLRTDDFNHRGSLVQPPPPPAPNPMMQKPGSIDPRYAHMYGQQMMNAQQGYFQQQPQQAHMRPPSMTEGMQQQLTPAQIQAYQQQLQQQMQQARSGSGVRYMPPAQQQSSFGSMQVMRPKMQ